MAEYPGLLDIRTRLASLLHEHSIPGGSVAILDHGIITGAAAGIANLRTNTPVTEETVFLIGSITKVLTATLVMRFVDAGQIDLDAPVVTYLPDLQLATPEFTRAVTVRHLLSHTSGSADFFGDFGRGDDAVAALVRSLADVPPIASPGVTFSYSNSAYVLLGALLERLSGIPWHALLRRDLLDPLGMTATAPLLEDIVRHPIAVAHRRIGPEDDQLDVGPMWPEVVAVAPAGFTMYATPADLLRFVQMHLAVGLAPDGSRLLREEGVHRMQRPEVADVPSGGPEATGWGLGWALYQAGDDRMLGHNGGVCAMLRVLPERGFAVAVLTNAAGGTKVGNALIAEILQHRFGIVPKETGPVARPLSTDLERFAGEFRHLGHTVTVSRKGDGLVLHTNGLARPSEEPVPLVPTAHGAHLITLRDFGPFPARFLLDADGAPDVLHLGLRAYRRETNGEA